MLILEYKQIKSYFKRKISINKANIIMFLITGTVISYSTLVEGTSTGVNSIAIGQNSEATDKDSIAIGTESKSSGDESISIGTGSLAKKTKAISIGSGARAILKNAIAIGADAVVSEDYNNGNDVAFGGIAIGRGSTSLGLTGNARVSKILKMGRTEISQGIAIGENTVASAESIDIGSRTYTGNIGDVNINGKLTAETSGMSNVTIGSNSFNKATFSNIVGSWNSISTVDYNPNERIGWLDKLLNPTAESNVRRRVQSMGSNILGSFNSIENVTPYDLAYSGLTNSILGTANKIKSSNGALVIGGGNEITNSYLEYTGLWNKALSSGKDDAKTIADSLLKYSTDNTAGSTLALGSGNRVNLSIGTTVTGIRNKVTNSLGEAGLADNSLHLKNLNITNVTTDIDNQKVNVFNDVHGYENEADNIKKSRIVGTKNVLKHATQVEMSGNNLKIIGTADKLAKNNIYFGNNNGNGETKESLQGAVILGTDNKAMGDDSVVIGTNTQGLKDNTITIGKDSKTGGINSITIGLENDNKSENSLIIGKKNTLSQTANNTFVLGNNINATKDNNVILGNDSSENSATTTNGQYNVINEATVNGITYSGFAGKDAILGVVSVGSKENGTRQIINVAPGKISEDSTDAINGSQLYLVANEVGNKLNKTGDNLTEEDKKKLVANLGLGDVVNNTTLNTKLGDKLDKDLSNLSVEGKKSIGALHNIVGINGITATYSVDDKGVKTTTISMSKDFKDSINENTVGVNGIKVETTKDKNGVETNTVSLDDATKAKLDSIGSGKVEKGNTNTITGDTVFNAIQNINISVANLGSGKIIAGDTNTVTGDTVFKAISKIDKVTVSTDSKYLTVNPVESKNEDGSKTVDYKLGFDDSKLDKLGKSADAGIASSVAMANLPQVSNIGMHRHNIAASVGVHRGETAIALGLSGLNHRGSLVYKASGALNTKGHVSFGIGIGYQFDKNTRDNDTHRNDIIDLKEKLEDVIRENTEYKQEIQEYRKEQEQNKAMIEQLMKRLETLEKTK